MTGQIPATMNEMARGIERLLAEHGPTTEGKLQQALAAAGLDLGRDPDATVAEVLSSDDLPTVVPLADDRYASWPALMKGRVLTHRLTELEAAYDLVTLQPDLDPIAMLTEVEQYRRIDDGATLTEALPGFDDEMLLDRGVPIHEVDPEGVLLLPTARYAELGVTAGDLVGFTVTSDGLAVRRLDAVPKGVPERLPAAVDTLLPASGAERPEMLTSMIWTACANDPELFTAPTLPLTDLLDGMSLDRRGDWVARAGFDFDRWWLDRGAGAIARMYHLETDAALVVQVLAQLHQRLYDESEVAIEQGDLEAIEPALRFLADPDVARGVLGESLGVDRGGSAALRRFSEILEPRAPRAALPALRWLRATASERMGAIADAEDSLKAAEEVDPSWSPALYDLARYASDRGEAERALSLLHRAGAPPDDELVQLLNGVRPQPRTDLGRNQPCWCGSGRKYKQCHLRRELPSLADRAGWLYDKAATYADRGPNRRDILAAAQERARHREDEAALLEALLDPFVIDTVLFEGGVFAEFLQVRGMLLPEDEQILAQQWLLGQRSVYEVESVRTGRGLTIRDLRTGDRLEVIERTGSRELRAGMLICVRILSVGDSLQIFGGIEPVSLAEREDLIRLLDEEPGPAVLVAFLSRRFAPPTMMNTEGEPMVLCESTLDVADPTALAAALDDTYDRSESDAPEWIEYVLTDGMQRVRATLRLVDDQLHVDTNSEARMDRVLATVRGLQPAVSVASDSRRPAADIQEAMSRAPEGTDSPGSALADPTDPDVAAALEEFVRQHEQNWLDESIPALDDYTPRQAAADPTRREDLIRLLDSFPEADRPGAMSPQRLRDALGISRD